MMRKRIRELEVELEATGAMLRASVQSSPARAKPSKRTPHARTGGDADEARNLANQYLTLLLSTQADLEEITSQNVALKSASKRVHEDAQRAKIPLPKEQAYSESLKNEVEYLRTRLSEEQLRRRSAELMILGENGVVEALSQSGSDATYDAFARDVFRDTIATSVVSNAIEQACKKWERTQVVVVYKLAVAS